MSIKIIIIGGRRAGKMAVLEWLLKREEHLHDKKGEPTTYEQANFNPTKSNNGRAKDPRNNDYRNKRGKR